MDNNIDTTPKDVFLYLLNILTFYISVIGFIILCVQYISALFPDPLSFYYSRVAGAVRIASSILFVAIPVYVLTSWLLGRDLRQNPKKREMGLRKWLTYFTLFVSAVTIIVTLIMVVNSFLSGELTIQFLLKILTVLLVAAAVFGYYIWDLRRKDQETSKKPKFLAWLLAMVVLGSIIAGFFIIGTPAEQRDRRFDERRTSDLQQLQWQIINYWQQKDELPQTLADLQDSVSGFVAPTDPETEASYEYNILGELSFELCAEFETSSKEFMESYRKTRDQSWEHEKGKICFKRTIDPDLYKSENRVLKAVPVRD